MQLNQNWLKWARPCIHNMTYSVSPLQRVPVKFRGDVSYLSRMLFLSIPIKIDLLALKINGSYAKQYPFWKSMTM